MMKTQCKTRGGVLLLALLLAAALGLSTVGFLSAKAAPVDATYDAATQTTTVTATAANEGDGLKKMFDLWDNADISFTEEGVHSAHKNNNVNLINICGGVELTGEGFTTEINFPIWENGQSSIVSNSAHHTLIEIYDSGIIAKIQFFHSYKPDTAYINATLTIGSAKVENIRIPKAIFEKGKSVKVGFNLTQGWCAETVDAQGQTVAYGTLSDDATYRQALQAITAKASKRIRIASHYNTFMPECTVKSLNGQNWQVRDGNLNLQKVPAAFPVMETAGTVYQIGQSYGFQLISTAGCPGTYPTPSGGNVLYLPFVQDFIGNVGFNTDGSKGPVTDSGIYMTVTDPNGQKQTSFNKSDWDKNNTFTPTVCGTHNLEFRILTVKGYTVTRSIDVFVEPTTVVTEGNVTVSDGTITLPTAKAGDANGNTVDEGTVTVTAKRNNEAVTVTDGKIADAQAGAYVVTYSATVNGADMTPATVEFYYDGTQIITDDIAVTTELSSDMILTSDTLSGTGGTVGTVVTVKFGEQAAVTAPVTADGWEATLSAVDAATTGDLVITYGGQSFTYTGVRRGVTYTVTATAGAHGAATADVAVVQHGGTVTFTVTADEGYRVATVKLGDEDKTLTDGRLVVENVTANLTLTVTFEEIPQPVFYTVTVADVAHGRVTASVASVEEGGTVTFTVTADSGYTVDTVKLNGVDKTLAEGRLVVENVAADLTLAVTFKAVESTEPYAPESGCGCNGTVGGVSAALALLSLLGAAVVAKKRK